MRFFRTLINTVLIIIIVGGLGYIGYNVFYMGGMDHGNITNPPSTSSQGTSGSQQPPAQGQNAPVNTVAIKNRERLSEAVTTINQALELITIDPYAKATIPHANVDIGNTQSSPSQGNINIYPGANSSVNVNPNDSPPANVPPASNQQEGNTQQNQNFVYDQNKLLQLHNGIFTLAQGIMMVNQLNDDLLTQSAILEANPPNYQTYVIRYNTALRNKTTLNNAINMLNQASTLVNVNPYAPQNGYPYDQDTMQQVHQGIYKLAQGMVLLNRLNEDFTQQMVESSVQAQVFINAGGQIQNLHSGGTGLGILSNLNFSTVFSIILLISLIGLIGGIIGGIFNLFGPRRG